MSRYKDITGQRFGRLVAIQPAGRTAEGLALWQCQCDCNNTCIVRGGSLGNGHSRSCGCLKKETRHGHARRGKHHPIYEIWRAMRDRCNNPNHPDFKNYGGRGIKVCDRWNNFATFLADVGERPHSKLVLDRIDNNGNYEPGNVRWTTYSESNKKKRLPKTRKNNQTGFKGVYWHKKNKRYTAQITFRGKTTWLGSYKTAGEAARAYDYVASRVFGGFALTNKAMGLLD
jgi:hypothetical protein